MSALIKYRIADAIRANGGSIMYYDLAKAVFPEADYPRAWAYPTRGGPPGCFMALSRAIRRHGFAMRIKEDITHSIVTMGDAEAALTHGEPT